MRRVGAVMSCLVVVGACGGGSAGSASDSPPTTVGAPIGPLSGVAIDSGILGVPLPKEAVKDDRLTTMAAPDGAVWRAPAGVTLDDLAAWYRAQMPVGSTWRGHKWCDETSNAEAVQFVWRQAKPGDYVIVLLSPPASGPAGIEIINQRDDDPNCG